MSGTITCIAEYRRKGNLGVITEVNPPQIISPLFRRAGAHCAAVLLDKATGGCPIEDVMLIVKEQESDRGRQAWARAE